MYLTCCISVITISIIFYSVIIPEKLDGFINKYAEYTHDKWAFEKVKKSFLLQGDHGIGRYMLLFELIATKNSLPFNLIDTK